MVTRVIAHTIHLLFLCYTILLFIRVIGSWFPSWRHHSFMRFVAHYTDPYLGLFRKFIPPIGGVFDLSPLIAFIVLQILEKIIIAFVT
jgi:YggT family protein